MTARAAADVLAGGPAGTTGTGLYVVRVVDRVDERITGRDGCVYTSPPQRVRDALALAGLLIGGPVDLNGGDGRWTRTVAIAGGRRTVTVAPSDPCD